MDNQNEQQQQRLIIRPYDKTWKIESRIYAIQNLVLPVPIEPRELLYFFVSAVFMFVLSQVIPPFTAFPAFFRYGIAPFALTKILTKLKLDGLPTLVFFGSLFVHAFTYRRYTENFEEHSAGEDKIIKINWWCSHVKMPD